MEAPITVDRLRFLLYSVKEKLWVKPLGEMVVLCIQIIAVVMDGPEI